LNIGKDTIVNFHYRLSDNQGNELESSRDGEPVAYLHGHRGIIRGLEDAMEGRKKGDSFSADISAALAYGPRREDAVQRVPIKHLLLPKASNKAKLSKGMQVKINTSEGPRDVSVVKVGKFNVDVDSNHPLAGKDLHFDVEVVDVREASAEELAHGHAHGPGGHHH